MSRAVVLYWQYQISGVQYGKRLREAAKTNAEKEAASREASRHDHDPTRRELHKVHTQLFESQQRVYALEKQLLALRAAVNEQPLTQGVNQCSS